MERSYDSDVERLRLRTEAVRLSEMRRGRKPSKRDLYAAIGRISDTGIVIGVTREEILECIPDSVKTFADLERWEKKVKEIILNISPDAPIRPQVCGSHKGFLKAARLAKNCLKEEVLCRIGAIK